jgi:hypothetical protein
MFSEMILSLHNRRLTEITDGSLGIFVATQSREHCCRYSAHGAGPSKVQQLFFCQMYSNLEDKKPYEKCQSYIELRIVEGVIYFISANWEHSHPTTKEYFGLSYNCISPSERAYIQQATKYGASATAIRTAIRSSLSKDSLYHIRKWVLDRSKYNSETEELIEETKNWPGLVSEFFIDKISNRFLSAYFFHTRVLKQFFVTDIVFVDDTFSTNHFDLPVIALI